MQWFYGTLHYSWTSLLRSQTFKYNASVKRGGPTGRNYIEEEEEDAQVVSMTYVLYFSAEE